jgi:fimbrial chaperone protein
MRRVPWYSNFAPMKSLARTLPRSAIACAAWLLFAAAPLRAGEFAVTPLRLELNPTVRSGVVTIKNDGKEKLSFQLEAKEWTQDAAGTDQYADTRDLIFFPKILAVEAGQEGLVRIGTRTPVVPTEKTYRLFIEELPPSARQPEASGAQVNVLIRFGEPIFVAPLKAQDGLEIEGPVLTAGALKFSARNTGNRHQFVQGIQLKGWDVGGTEVYALTLADRYLLAGTVKAYTASIAGAQCLKVASLEVEVKTDKANAKRKLDVTRAMCP